jgi:dTDP-4-dehydrorhamnose reductase
MNILITGGSGFLGMELCKLLPLALHPTRDEMNICSEESISSYFKKYEPGFVIHCAGYMPPNKVNEFPKEALTTNIVGTCLITSACIMSNTPLIYISTDYVFKGDRGNYKETDELLPVNKYAWSKLGGECAVRMYDRGLIVRTSFGSKEFPHPTEYTDQWTSKEPVGTIAKKIVLLIGKRIYGVIHLGTDRETVYECSKKYFPYKDVGKTLMPQDDYIRPVDTSLNTEKFRSIE